MGAATGHGPLEVTVGHRVPAVAIGTTSEFAFARAPFKGTVKAVRYMTDALITGVNTNTRKVAVRNKGQSGAGTTEAAGLQFNSGVNAAAYDETAVTLSGTTANLDVNEGDVVAWRSEAIGTGLADPGGVVEIVFARD